MYFVILDILPKIPKVLYKTDSPISGEIRVIQKGSERRLLINGVKQSVNPGAPNIEKRYWSQVADLAYRYKWTRIESILILGLGGGTVGHFFQRRFPGALMDGVELDPLVIEAGKNFFDLGRLESLQPLCGDAYEVIHRPIDFELRSSLYDLVLVDVFSGGTFPEEFAQRSFLDRLRRFIHPGGIVIFNQTARSSKHLNLELFREKLSSFYGDIYQEKIGAELGFSNFLISASRV